MATATTNSMADEIAAVISEASGEAQQQEAPKQEAPKQQQQMVFPKQEAPKQEEPPKQEAQVEVPTQQEQPPVEQEYDVAEQNKILLEQMNQMGQQLYALQEQLRLGQTPQPEVSKVDFVSQEDFDNGIFDSPQKINALLTSVEAKTRENIERKFVPAVEKIILRKMSEYAQVQEFYGANPDLKGWEWLVAQNVNTLQARGVAPEKLAAEAAKVTRAQLRSAAKKAPAQPVTQPAAPMAPKASAAPAQPSVFKRQFDAMAESVGLGELLAKD